MTKIKVFPTIGMVLKNTFKEIYQSFSYSVLTGIIYGTISIPTLLIIVASISMVASGSEKNITANELFSVFIWAMILGAIWNTFVVAPATTAFYSFYQVKKETYPGIKTFFSLFRKYYRPSIVVNGLFSLTFILLFTNVMIGIIERSTLLFVTGMLSFYLQIFISLMSFYFAPLIYLNNGIKKTIKKAFLLVLDNTLLTIVLMLVLGVLFGVTMLFPVFWFLIYGAILVYVTDLGFNAIYDRYE
mgnify:CR=1 FL=1